MLTDPPSDVLDVLVVGGLTIDRFEDGSSTAGGAVIHIARAAASRGLRLGVMTAAGPEPVAVAGVAELRRLSQVVEVAPRAVTTIFRHRETPEGRQLWLEQRGGPVALPSESSHRWMAHAVLLAPVADEIGIDALEAWDPDRTRCAILQGWLRGTADDGEVEPLRVSSRPAPLREGLATMDLIVASREDMRADGDDPANQLLALRRAVGDGPAIVVTDGRAGLWLSTGASATHLAVPWTVEGVSTVGAGDVLAAFMLAAMAAGEPPMAATEQAMRIVAQVLEEWKRG